jgi:phosphoenolpyruvate carboxykinase (ATP)
MTSETMEPVMAGTDEGAKRLEGHGLEPSGNVYVNLCPARLYEESLARGDGRIAHMGAFSAVTAPHTGRSPNDRFVVRDETSEDVVDWGKVNVPVSTEHYEALREDVVTHLNDRDLFVHDARAG